MQSQKHGKKCSITRQYCKDKNKMNLFKNNVFFKKEKVGYENIS